MEANRLISIMEELDTVTGVRKVLFETEGRIEAPNWLKDGRILYNRDGRIWLYDGQTHSLVETGEAIHCNNDHVLSPDGTQLGISHNVPGEGSKVYTVPLTGGQPQQITPVAPSYLHGWSPDGQTLAYCACRDGEYDIYTVPVAGGEETRLTTAPGLNDGPEYAPDGSIWFNSVRTGLMQMWHMNADGSAQRQITFDRANSWFPHISPDGRFAAYIAYREGDVNPGDHPADKHVQLRLLDIETEISRPLADLFGGQGTLNVNSWAPDSRRLAFVSYRYE